MNQTTQSFQSLVKKYLTPQRGFFLLTLIVGLIALLPLNNFQAFIATGDHGRDLYAFKKTLDGAFPYRDYSWLFGPLMPLYYALLMKLLGVSINSVLVGQNLLLLLTGLTIFLIASVFLPPSLSFIAAVWYWAYRGTEFFYTYNHTGGLLCLLVSFLFVYKYIVEPKRKFLVAGAAAILGILLIRPNLGVSTLAAFFLSIVLIDFWKINPERRKRFFLLTGLTALVLLVGGLIYSLLLSGLSMEVIKQSFPFGKNYRTDSAVSIPAALSILFQVAKVNITLSNGSKLISFILLLCMVETVFAFFRKKITVEQKKRFGLALATLFLFAAFNLHEFIFSGVFYRLAWVFPFYLLLTFLLFYIGTMQIRSSLIRYFLFLTFLILGLTGILEVNNPIRMSKKPWQLMTVGQTRVYSIQNPEWIATVCAATNFLKQNTKPNEKIFVLPFDPLYYFLAQRDSASRQLIFFEHNHISPAQEENIIKEIEEAKVNLVLVSNRTLPAAYSPENLGHLECPLIRKYLLENFEEVASIGDWANPGGWAWAHAVKILRKKSGS